MENMIAHRDRWETSKNDFERLADENETLRGLYEYNSKLAIDSERKLEQCKKSYEDELSRVHMLLRNAWDSVEEKDKLLGTIKADTIRKMQERLKAETITIQDHTGKLGSVILVNTVDQIAKEILED